MALSNSVAREYLDLAHSQTVGPSGPILFLIPSPNAVLRAFHETLHKLASAVKSAFKTKWLPGNSRVAADTTEAGP